LIDLWGVLALKKDGTYFHTHAQLQASATYLTCSHNSLN